MALHDAALNARRRQRRDARGHRGECHGDQRVAERLATSLPGKPLPERENARARWGKSQES
eukprot:6441285-Pyramimonas_sp.AAC.1